MPSRLLSICLILTSLVLAGCGSSTPEAKETPQTQANAQQAASAWTEEQKAAFAKAHNEARSGADEGKPAGSSK